MLKKLQKFLEDNKIKYETVEHKVVFTARDKAATLKVPEKIIGKTLVVKLDSSVALVLIPANKNLDKQKLRKIAKAKKVDFAKEAWMKKNLKGIKIGSVPPFGVIFKLPTFVDRGLTRPHTTTKIKTTGVKKRKIGSFGVGVRESEIIVSSGDYKTSIKINPAIFEKLIPGLVIGSFSAKRK